MSNISKYFNKISKKRDLSSVSLIQKRIEKKAEKKVPQPAIIPTGQHSKWYFKSIRIF